jgi:hypothetical protein
VELVVVVGTELGVVVVWVGVLEVFATSLTTTRCSTGVLTFPPVSFTVNLTS